MIKHIVMWKLDDPARGQDYLDGARDLLDRMRKGIDGLLHLEVALDQSRTEHSADLVLYSELTDWDALAVYDEHPLHQEFKDYLGPHRTERRVADYEIDQGDL